MQLIFRVKRVKEQGRSPIEIVLRNKNKISKDITDNTDNLLSALDKLFRKNKIELESLKRINLEIDKKAGLTSTRIVSAIIKALSLNL